MNPVQNMATGGWNAIYVALFGTMIGSTDAASVIAILKSGIVVAGLWRARLKLRSCTTLVIPLTAWLAGGAPEILSIILEGESLFNDASSLTMFEV